LLQEKKMKAAFLHGLLYINVFSRMTLEYI